MYIKHDEDFEQYNLSKLFCLSRVRTKGYESLSHPITIIIKSYPSKEKKNLRLTVSTSKIPLTFGEEKLGFSFKHLNNSCSKLNHIKIYYI